MRLSGRAPGRAVTPARLLTTAASEERGNEDSDPAKISIRGLFQPTSDRLKSSALSCSTARLSRRSLPKEIIRRQPERAGKSHERWDARKHAATFEPPVDLGCQPGRLGNVSLAPPKRLSRLPSVLSDATGKEFRGQLCHGTCQVGTHETT
jgi:hypothetical protein